MLRIELVRSLIGNTPRNRKTVAALGLRRLRQVVYHEDNPTIRGMVHKVKHMLTVAVVDASAATPKTQSPSRKAKSEPKPKAERRVPKAAAKPKVESKPEVEPKPKAAPKPKAQEAAPKAETKPKAKSPAPKAKAKSPVPKAKKKETKK